MVGGELDRGDAAANGRQPARRRGIVDGIIETAATALGDTIGWMAQSGVLFAIFAIIWVAFGAALIWSQGGIDQAWTTIRDWPLIVQALAWLLFLPVMAGLWVWETTWPLALRLLVVLGIAGWNLLVFLPRAAAASQP
jgi:hypothetical protein